MTKIIHYLFSIFDSFPNQLFLLIVQFSFVAKSV